MTISQRMAELGAKGGRKRSGAKQAACRANAAKARAAAAEKRALALPQPAPAAKSDNVSYSKAATPTVNAPSWPAQATPQRPAAQAPTRPAATTTIGVPFTHPSAPLRSDFELRVREIHKFFSVP